MILIQHEDYNVANVTGFKAAIVTEISGWHDSHALHIVMGEDSGSTLQLYTGTEIQCRLVLDAFVKYILQSPASLYPFSPHLVDVSSEPDPASEGHFDIGVFCRIGHDIGAICRYSSPEYQATPEKVIASWKRSIERLQAEVDKHEGGGRC